SQGRAVVDVTRKPHHPAPGIVMVRQVAGSEFDGHVVEPRVVQDAPGHLGPRQTALGGHLQVLVERRLHLKLSVHGKDERGQQKDDPVRIEVKTTPKHSNSSCDPRLTRSTPTYRLQFPAVKPGGPASSLLAPGNP